MNIVELPTEKFVSTLWSADKHVRTPGLHLTNIIYPMMKEQGRTPERPDLTEDDLNHYQAVGFLWERVLTAALTEMELETNEHVVRLGEFSKDGILFTPDGLLLNLRDGATSLEEWKATFTSSNRDIEDKKQWWIQIMAYCYALELSAATVRVLYVCGNWRPPIPQTKHYRATFNNRELEENWLMLIQFAKSRGMMK